MKNLIVLIFLIVFIGNVYSESALKLNISAYTDTYISADNDRLTNPWETEKDISWSQRQFTFINAKKSSFDLNIAQISGNIDLNGLVRGKVTLQHGTLVETAYGNFPVQEAYMGVQPFEGLWIDAGYFLTHIGGESYLPKDNWLSSHSIVTYFEPFYHAGIKATYTKGPVTAGLSVCNGNGILNENNDNKSAGFYFAYNFGDLLSLSYASIIGNEEAGSSNNSKLHQLHNICLNSKPIKNLELKAQYDFSVKADLIVDGAGFKNGKYSGFSIQGRYTFLPKLKSTARFSLINDKDAVYGTGLNGNEVNLGIEYIPVSSSYIRLEGGMLTFDKANGFGDRFQNKNGTPGNSRMSLMLNFGVWLD